MKVLLGKFNNGKMCVSAIAVGLIVLICAVIIQAPIKGKAGTVDNSTYTIEYNGGSGNNEFNIGSLKQSEKNNFLKSLGIKSSYENNIKVLTFNKVNFTTSANIALKINADVSIKIEETNSIKSTSGMGIEVANNATLTIIGTGTLNVNSITGNGNLKINDNVEVIDESATFAETGVKIIVNGQQGIVCQSYTQTSGTVNVKNTAGVGIQAIDAININGGTTIVNSTGGNGIESTSGNITIGENGVIDVRSTNNAINAGGTVTFNNTGTCTLKSLGTGKGINSIGDISIGGTGTVEITESQYGMSTDGSVSISNGKLIVNSNGSGTRGGITSAGGVNITGGDVQVTTLSTDGKAYGISDSSSAGIVISGENVNVNTTTQRGSTSDVSAAISSKKVDISSGTTTINVNGVKAQGINVLSGGDGLSIRGEAQVEVKGDIQGYTGYDQSAVYVDSTMNVSGGSLSVDVTNKVDSTYITGITTKNNLIVNGGEVSSKVNVKYGDDSSNIYGQSDGILVKNNLEVNGGILKAMTNGQENPNASGIHVARITSISNGEVYVENNNPNYAIISKNLHGIFAEGGFTMSGGTFTAKGISTGMFVENQSLNITGGVITASTKKDEAHAIYVKKTATIENGDITLISDGNNSYGIYADQLTIGKESVTTGPTITINKITKDELKVYNGIKVSSNMTVYGGNIEIEISGDSARGIDAHSNLTIGNTDSEVGPTIIVKGDIKNDSSGRYDICGIYVRSAFTVNSGNIIVNLKNSQDTSYITGIYANSTMTMAGGDIEVNVDSKQSDDTYGCSDGMVVKGAMTLAGGKVVSKTNGATNESAGIHVNSMTVSGGKAEFRNTNVLDSVVNSVKRIGFYSDSSVTISGGYVIAQGMEQATLLTGIPNINYNAKNEYYSVTTLVTEDYNGANLCIYNSANNINRYKYVEFGKEYKNYIRYNVSNNKIYLGDKELDVTNDQSILEDIGISIISAGKLKITNMNFISKVEYGLRIEGDATIVISNNSDNTIYVEKDISAKDEYGIYCTGNLSFEGSGRLNVTGYKQAIYANNINYVSGTDYELKPTGTGENVTHTVSTKYHSNPDYSTIKYIEIGPVANYYLEYQASTGKMYKVVNDSNKTPINNNELVYGWSIAGDKTLVLDGFHFETCASKGLKIVGGGKVNVSNANAIVSLYDSQSGYTGIDIAESITLQGTGTLNLKKNEYTTDKYTGIASSGNVTIEGGTYNIHGETYGIKASGNTLAISNANVVIKGNAKAMDVGTCDIHAKVEGSTNYNGTNTVTITDINTTYNSTYLDYRYFNISPAIMTVNITWGSMKFSGQSVWEPSTHTYEGKYLPSESGADKILVENMATSNIPIFAKVKYNKLIESSAMALVNSITGTIATDKDNVAIGIGESSTSTLSIDGAITDTFKQDYGSTSTSVGTVSVTLSDYSIPD